MAGQQKPWEKDWSAPQGPVILGTPNPTRAPLDQAELQNRQLQAQKSQLEIEQLRTKMQQENGGPPIDPKMDALTGPAYLSALPKARAAQVQALIEGRMAFPSGAGMRSPYWQGLLTDVAHADPEFDAVNYNSRAATRRDFTAGKSAQNIKALNTAIGHVGQLYDQIGGTASHGGFPFATTVNALQNAYERSSGDSGVTKYDQTAGAVASELTQVFRGTGGAEADVKRYLGELNSNASAEQKKAAVQNIVGLLNSRLQAIGDQYTKGMGTTAQPLQVLDQHAQEVLGKLSGADGQQHPGAGPPIVGPTGGGSPPPPPPGFRGGPSADKTPQFYDPNGGGPGGRGLSKGQYHDVYDPQVSAQIDGMIRKGYSPDRINTALANTGRPAVDPKQVLAAQDYLRQHPDYKGGFANATNAVPTERPGLNTFQQSAPGVFLDQLSNAGTFGNKANLIGLAGGNADLQRGGMEQAATQHPYAATAGTLVGGTAGALATETGFGAAARGLGAGAKFAPWVARGADATYGGITGASENPDDPWAGVKGAAAGVAGGMFGSKVVAPVLGTVARKVAGSRFGQVVGNTVRDFRDLPPMEPQPQPLGAADSTLLATANKAGIPGIQAQLDEAARLGVPMSLADTHPALTSLGGAAVRRSPTADAFAQGAFIPRSRGQIDRFGQAVERDLGPVANIPQLSEDLARQAKTAAAPLYDQAYAANGVNSPQIDSLLATPFGREGLGRAHTIAANKQVDPTSLGIDLNAQGEPVLTRVPSMQTLDYAKQGMDDVLEQYRNPFGKLQLTPAGNAQNEVKNKLLAEIDRLNPAYKDARAAYGGPMQSRDALALGQDALGMNPDTLGMGLAGKSPEQMQQVQLGFRSGLMDQGNKVRYSTNPFDATLGTPAAEQRLGAVYPDHPGIPNLLRQRDLESGLARTTNDILGNSKTAQRGIADSAFAGDGLLQTGLDLGINAATGQVPIGTVIKGVGKLGLKDMIKLGVGKRAIAKADALAPSLFNTNPAQSSADLTALMNSSQAFRDLVESYNRRMSRPAGMFGAAAGTGLATRQ